MKKLLSLLAALVFVLCFAATVSAVEVEWEYISANDAYDKLNPASGDDYDPNAYILDVRTPCEWYFVGHPGENSAGEGSFLEGKVINIPFWLWEFDPKTKEYVYVRYNDPDTDKPNSKGLNKFFDENVVRQFDPGDTIILMCRSDGRGGYAGDELVDPTHPAAQRLEELGYYNIFNLGGGFESPGKVHDGITYVGWKPSGLPYNQHDAGIWKPTSDQKGRSLDK